ncbi:hypothetical protein CNECB9_1190033 [Cupriavidus necator]|uniref:Uncharacterized protein n=1 Tax=Cupriavidus necator TaxID=106590 RepID=A0A1K0I9R9_CUPNE|nr:hypothetical protein CNECB9_1190033 [Cupriavidus necator]
MTTADLDFWCGKAEEIHVELGRPKG